MIAPANIKDFRAAVRSHLQMAGFEPRRRGPKMPLAWVLPSVEVERVFFPHEIRRPWGFKLSGTLAIELPPLRRWLALAGSSPGIFRDYFVSYHLANDDLLEGLDAAQGEPPAVADWIGQVADRFADLPDTIDELARTYRRSPDHLGWFAMPMNKPAWDFLLRWRDNKDADLPVPQTLFA
jgi:hypothetical protein